MVTGLICGKWEMEFENQEALEDKSFTAKDEPWNVMFQKNLEIVSSHATVSYQLLSGLPQGLRLVEFYGGMGIQSKVARELLHPSEHTIVEKDPICINHLLNVFGEDVQIIQADAEYVIGTIPADIYLLDWNSWTSHQFVQSEHKFNSLLSTKPAAITWFDSAKPYFHFHKQRYGEEMGMTKTPENLQGYAVGVSKMFYDRYGYSISKAVYRSRGEYFLLTPGSSTTEHINVPNGTSGFKWVA